MTKQEIKATTLIFVLLIILTSFNLNIARRKSRDATRRADLGAIADGLEKFQVDFSFFPGSDNGKINACKADNFDEKVLQLENLGYFDKKIFFEGLRGCIWGKDGLYNPITNKTYISVLPQDPKIKEGYSYYYLSDNSLFQIYTYLEGENKEVGYNSGILGRNLPCGMKVCNSGKSYSDIPLDISIEEYFMKLKK